LSSLRLRLEFAGRDLLESLWQPMLLDVREHLHWKLRFELGACAQRAPCGSGFAHAPVRFTGIAALRLTSRWRGPRALGSPTGRGLRRPAPALDSSRVRSTRVILSSPKRFGEFAGAAPLCPRDALANSTPREGALAPSPRERAAPLRGRWFGEGRSADGGSGKALFLLHRMLVLYMHHVYN
jgi:hypothetical protein